MKTNDVTGRFGSGEVGVAIELGRPGTGVRFREVGKVTQAMAEFAVEFEPQNPTTFLLKDKATGEMNGEVLAEKVLSAIVEFTIPLSQIAPILTRLRGLAHEIETVFSLNLIVKVEPDGAVPAVSMVQDLGIPISINGKSNAGLGQPLYREA